MKLQKIMPPKQKSRKKIKKPSENAQKNFEDDSPNEQATNNGTTSLIPTVQLPRAQFIPNHLITNNLLSCTYEELYGKEKEEVLVRIEKKENIHYIHTETISCSYNSRDFTPPQIINARLVFISLMSCSWCLQIFNAERVPLCFELGTSVCLECIMDYTKDIPFERQPFYSLNFGYVQLIHNLLKDFKIFNSDIPVYSELERGIYNKRNYFNLSRLISDDLKEKNSQLVETLKHYNDFESRNSARSIIIQAAIDELDEFRNTFYSQDIIEWQKCLLKTTTDIKRLREQLIEMEYRGPEADWLLWSKRVYLEPSKTVSRLIFRKMSLFGFQYYVVIHKENDKSIYSKLYCINNGLFIPAFTPTFPSISNLGVASILEFIPSSLKKVDRLYFEIPVGNETVHGLPFRSARFQIFLGYPESSWYFVYLFLGNDKDTFLGAEIEVTDDEIIFCNYLRDGITMTEPKPKPSILDMFDTVVKVERGLVVSHVRGRSTKLTIFKHSHPREIVASFFGYVDRCSVGSLLRIPLGIHRISACGMGCNV